MKQNDIATPSRTADILKQFGLQAKKSLGQNFIVDRNILENIVSTGQIDDKTIVIEVGPGIGALTEQIAKRANHVYAFEIDSRLLPVLDTTLKPYPNVTILHKDILEVDLNDFQSRYIESGMRIVVMANLPYYITTPIIMRFLESELKIDQLVFMIQKEVAQRVTATPSTKAYGSLSIAVQYYATASISFIVPRTVFRPQPNVDSAIISLTSRMMPPIDVVNEAFFFQMVKACFAQRRKTLWNNLKTAFGKESDIQCRLKTALMDANIDSTRRGETLTLAEFGELSNQLVKQGFTR